MRDELSLFKRFYFVKDIEFKGKFGLSIIGILTKIG
jgi:hypothetical protein